MLCTSNHYLFSFFKNLSLFFNICLCYDLVKTLKDPFSPGSRRLKYYILFSLPLAGFFAFYSESENRGKPLDRISTQRSMQAEREPSRP